MRSALLGAALIVGGALPLRAGESRPAPAGWPAACLRAVGASKALPPVLYGIDVPAVAARLGAARPEAAEAAWEPAAELLARRYPSPRLLLAERPEDAARIVGEALAVAAARRRWEARRLARAAAEGRIPPGERGEALRRLSRLETLAPFYLRESDLRRLGEARRLLLDAEYGRRRAAAAGAVAAAEGAWSRDEGLEGVLLDDPGTAVFTPGGFASVADFLNHIEPGPETEAVHSEGGYRALVEGRGPESRAVLGALASRPGSARVLLNAMYYSLVRVSVSALADPWLAAGRLAPRFSSFLRRVEADPEVSPEDRAMAGLARSRYLDTGLLVRLLVEGAFAGGEGRKALARHEGAGPASRDWVVPARVMPEGAGPGLEVQRLSWNQARRGQLAALAQVELLERLPPAEPGLLEAALQTLREAQASLGRFAAVTLGFAFTGLVSYGLLFPPATRGLRLVPVRGGVLLEARFETDIDDPAFTDWVRRSIEDHWRGGFEEGGRRRSFRTRVDIRRLEPGEAFTGERLQLTEAPDGTPHAGGLRLAMARGADYAHHGVPAHEFGHLLGLGDEYREWFEPWTETAAFETEASSLMGSHHTGRVLPRHLRLAAEVLGLQSRPSPWTLRGLVEIIRSRLK